MARSSIYQVTQVGPESVSGTDPAAGADILLQSIGLRPAPNLTAQLFRPSGQKYNTVQAMSQEWATWALDGLATYDEIVYPLSSAIDVATITTPGGGTDARQWAFESAPSAADAPVTYYLQHGDSTIAEDANFGLIADLSMTWTREGNMTLGGSMISRRLETGASLTASPTRHPLIPILGSDIDVYMDTTSAGLGTTQLTSAYEATFSIGGRYGMTWPLNSSLDSWDEYVELPPTVTFSLMLEADATGMGLLATARTGDTRFFRVAATGPEVEAGVNYEFEIDFAGKIESVDPQSDRDGVYQIGWQFSAVTDPTWGKAFSARVINSIAAL